MKEGQRRHITSRVGEKFIIEILQKAERHRVIVKPQGQTPHQKQRKTADSSEEAGHRLLQPGSLEILTESCESH